MHRGLGYTEAKSLLGTKDKMVTLKLRFLSVGSQRESTGKKANYLHFLLKPLSWSREKQVLKRKLWGWVWGLSYEMMMGCVLFENP